MKEKILFIILVLILIIGLIAIANYINQETIKRITEETQTNTNVEENQEVVEEQEDPEIIQPIEETAELTKDATVTSDTFEEKVLNSKSKVIVDFYADWCGPCQMLSPILEEVINNQDEVLLYKVDTDIERVLSSRYRIIYLPTLVVFENGEEVNRSIGLISKDEVVELLK